MTKQSEFFVYILSSQNNNVLYIGVTSNLVKRIYGHKNKLSDGFTKKYNVNKLVYYEVLQDPENAITREKQLKAGPRQKKIELINKNNPTWEDLYEEII